MLCVSCDHTSAKLLNINWCLYCIVLCLYLYFVSTWRLCVHTVLTISFHFQLNYRKTLKQVEVLKSSLFILWSKNNSMCPFWIFCPFCVAIFFVHVTVTFICTVLTPCPEYGRAQGTPLRQWGHRCHLTTGTIPDGGVSLQRAII